MLARRGLFGLARTTLFPKRAFSDAPSKEPGAIAAARKRAEEKFKPRTQSAPIMSEYKGLSLTKQHIPSSRITIKTQRTRPPQRSGAPPPKAETLLQAAGTVASQTPQQPTTTTYRAGPRIRTTYRKNDGGHVTQIPSDRRSPSLPKKGTPPTRLNASKQDQRIKVQLTEGNPPMPSSLAQQPDRESGIEAIEAILAEALDSTSVGEDPLVESALTEFELQPRDVSALLGDGAFTTVPDELSRASRTLPAVEIPRSTANPTPTAERQFRSIQKTRRTFGLRPSSLKTSSAPQGKHSGPGMEHGPTPDNLIDPHIYISTLPGAVRFKREQVGGDYDRLLQFVPRSDKRVLDLAIPPLARNGSISLEGRARAVRAVEKLTSSA